MDPAERIDELLDRWEELRAQGHALTAEDLCRPCPELLDELRRRITVLRSLAWLERPEGRDQALSSPAPSPSPVEQLSLAAGGEPVAGYRLVARLGRGGSGEVWRATGPGGYDMALKFVPLGSALGEAELRALELMRDVRHPNLLGVFGVWRLGENLAVACELAEGTLLDRLGEAVGSGQAGIPLEELLHHLEDAALGLDHLHAAGLQHRDVKPQNLLLVGGRVKVADFGLVKALHAGGGGHTGRMTPAYAAPEFLGGTTAPQSDQYSLAVVYCQLRGGRLPFSGSVADLVLGQRNGRPDLSTLPPAERPAVARALALDPTRRWPTCAAFVAALRQAASRATGEQGRPGHKQKARLACLLLLAVLLLPSLFTAPSGTTPTPEPPPEVKRPGEVFCLRGHRAAVTSVALSPDGVLGVSGGEDNAVIVWDLRRGQLLHRLEGHTRPVRCVAVDGEADRVLSGAGLGDNSLRLWDVRAGKEVGCLRGHRHGVRGVAFVPGGRQIVSGSFDGTARLWDLQTGSEAHRFEGLTRADVSPTGWGRQVWSLALSGDGRRLACGLRDRSIRLFDVPSGKLLKRLRGHTQFVNAAALSADGRRLLSGTGDLFRAEASLRPDRAVRWWNLPSGREERCWRGLVGDVWSVALQAEGRRAVVAGEDGTLLYLDLASGRELCRLRGHSAPVASVAVATSRGVALSGGVDGSVRLWRLPE